MKTKMVAKACGVAAVLASVSPFAYSAGFQLTEQSIVGLGRAYGGAGIVGDDLSAVYYNPAGMTLLPGTAFQIGGTLFDLDIPYTGYNGHDDNARNGATATGFAYFTTQLNDQWWFGLGLTVPYGMSTSLSREMSRKGDYGFIMTMDLNPNIAWKPTEWLSVGVGASLQYARAKLGASEGVSGLGDVRVKITGRSWAPGWNAGIMLSPTPDTRFGLAYRSQVKHSANGHLDVTGVNSVVNKATMLGNMMGLPLGAMVGGTLSAKGLREGRIPGASTMITTPSTLSLTATTKLTDKLRLSGMIRWSKWSNFTDLDIKTKQGKVSTVRNRWKDTWLFSVGADYAYSEALTLRAGLAYDTSPIDDRVNRMAIIPDCDRIWFTFGGGYKFSKNLQVDVGAAILRGVRKAGLYDNETGKKMGNFHDSMAYLVGGQLLYRF